MGVLLFFAFSCNYQASKNIEGLWSYHDVDNNYCEFYVTNNKAYRISEATGDIETYDCEMKEDTLKLNVQINGKQQLYDWALIIKNNGKTAIIRQGTYQTKLHKLDKGKYLVKDEK